MSAAAADTASRQLAQREFVRPLLLEAGAGTGKTSVLVARVVAWCLGPGWERHASLAGDEAADPAVLAAQVLDRVVAVTFTEAAAAEMEERIGRALRLLASEEPACAWPVELDRGALPGDAAVLRARARALLGSFDRLRVSTIHAFCRRLLAEHAIEAGIHPRFSVDARGLARAAAAREAVEAWLHDAGQGEGEDLLALVEAGLAAPELEAMLGALLAASVPPELFAADPLAPERVRAFATRLERLAQAFLDAEAGCLLKLGARSTGCQVAEAAARIAGALRAHSCEDAGALATLLEEIREAWSDGALGRLGEFSKRRFTAKIEEGALEGRIEDVVRAAADLDGLVRHALRLDPVRLALAHRVLAPLHVEATAAMRRQGHESFDALLRKAARLLDAHPGVAARVRARIDQLLVDEFQDTDAAQCEIVARLGLDGTGQAARPGLFVVGDPKQSIYGWRNADLEAYERFRARLREAGGAVHPLSMNHRSAPALLDEVERAMRGVMVEIPGAQPAFEKLLADPAIAAATASEGGPIVEHWLSSRFEELAACDDAARKQARTPLEEATEREAAYLASDLLRLAREARESGADFAWSRVGILLRTTSDVDRYLEKLRESGIPYTVSRDRQYYERREVVEARALVRAVLDPSDQIALVAALRSAWAGVPDVAWRPLWLRGFPEAVRNALGGAAGGRDAVLAAVRRAAADVQQVAASVPGLDALAGWEGALVHAADVLVALRRAFETEPAERFVELLRTLPLLEVSEATRFLGAWRLANLDRFLRELGEALEALRGDATALLRALRRDDALDADWDEGRPQHPSEDAVQVMTIHGAKGLEFDHVYVLQLHKGQGRRRDERFRAGQADLAGEWRFGATGVATLDFDCVDACCRRIEEHESVRTLYVAMTRARRRLVLAGHWSEHATQGVHGRLLASSLGAAQREAVAHGRAAGDAWDGSCDEGRVRWVFLDRVASGAPAPPAPAPDAPVDLDRARSDAARLAAARGEAQALSRRALTAAATAESAAERREASADEARDPRRRARPHDVEVAAAVGSALHALLERLGAEGESDAGWQRESERACASIERAVAPEARARAQARAEALLHTLRAGMLWRHLEVIAPRVVARELPVLIEPEVDAPGPVGAIVGAIDLLYRGAAPDEWVVADFKTDRIAGAAALRERVEHHRAQGRAYRRAVARALDLERAPRFELWFLDADRIVSIED